VIGDCNPDLLVAGGDVVPEFGQREKLVETGRLLVGGSASWDLAPNSLKR